MDKHKEAIRALKDSINVRIDEAIGMAQEGNLEKAKEIQAEIEEMKAELAGKEAELAELESFMNLEKLPVEDERAEDAAEADNAETEVLEEEGEELRSDDDLEDLEDEDFRNENTEKETRNMANLNDFHKSTEKTELRSAIDAFIRSKGVEKRDGITTVDAGAVIPEEILTTPQEQPETVVDLKKYVNVLKVSTGSGSYPVLAKQDAVMSTASELAENPELAQPNFSDVDFKIETYRGQLAISQEALDDSAIDLAALVAKDINKQALNTVNKAIATIMKGFTAKTMADLDDLKKIVNVDIDPAYDVKFYMSQSMFNAIDTMKDNMGRYILNQDITVASGYKLFGREVVVLADKVIGTDAGDMVAFVGDAKAAVAMFDRKQVSVRWVDHEIYGQYLASMVRFDVEDVDANAGFYVSLTDTPDPDPVDPEDPIVEG